MQKLTESETLFYLLARCSNMIGRGHHHRGGSHHGQGRILSILSEDGTMSQRELMELLQIRSASLSELLGKLDAGGCVTRDKNEGDKRNVNITITEKGKAVAAEYKRWRQDTAAALFAPLREDERAALSRLLLKLLTAWREERNAANFGHHFHHHDERHHGGHEECRDKERHTGHWHCGPRFHDFCGEE